MRLQDKLILITAAGQGIGRGAALACAREGARVVATDINAAALETLAAEAPGIRTQPLDARDRAAVEALAALIGPLDGLFNCAGHVHDGTIMDTTEADWAFSFELNVTAMFRTIQVFLPGMLEVAARRGAASILNMASVASSLKGFPRRTVYGASKAAVIGLTKGVAADYVRQGIRVNALCPGTADTPSLRGRIAASPDPVQAEKDFIARQPMGRLATVDDMTGMIVYLLSDESRFVTGQALAVDGGILI
ncbi:MAG: SDR family oxidoreductase [Rhodobacteraceae bacterium]|nr:SDR family oxidoreductase [Paracoccaceae bacterium]